MSGKDFNLYNEGGIGKGKKKGCAVVLTAAVVIEVSASELLRVLSCL